MKKMLLVLCLLLALCGCALAENAPETYTSGDYEYILQEDGTAKITGYNGDTLYLKIPAEMEGAAVTALGEYFLESHDPFWVILPDTLTTLDDFALDSLGGESSFEEIFIPHSVTKLGMNPFRYCFKLAAIQVDADHPVLATIDGVLFDKTEKKLICYPCAYTATEYTVPWGVKSIGDYAFTDSYSLERIDLNGVSSIGMVAFGGCMALKEVIIPEHVTEIPEAAFASCRALESVYLPSGLQSIGEAAFADCWSLREIAIPASVTYIHPEAFNSSGAIVSIRVERDSYAAQWCRENRMPYHYPDSDAWLDE